ncbi:MAG: response regulator [Candidatus Electrothrix sp. GM3_4]|nr:response regulator [Candidatus Electrothrix sp. GM3_4]
MEKKWKILLVDDEESVVLLFVEELQEEGYEAEGAFNGDQALDKFKADPPDLVILDINMPGMSGIEVLRQIREMNADVPVIISSAYPHYEGNFPIWDFPPATFVVKSANTDELIGEVRKYLNEPFNDSKPFSQQKKDNQTVTDQLDLAKEKKKTVHVVECWQFIKDDMLLIKKYLNKVYKIHKDKQEKNATSNLIRVLKEIPSKRINTVG